MAIKLGTVVTDKITGFKGVAMSRTEFLHGCVRISIQPKPTKAGSSIPSLEWVDELQMKENDPKTTPKPSAWLGKKAKDKISGFEGIVTSRSEYLHSSPRIAITTAGLFENKPIDAQGFDEAGVEGVDTPAPSKRTGGPGDMAKHHRMAPSR